MTYPTEQQRIAIQAFLGGYLDAKAAIAFADVTALIEQHFPTVAPVDGMMVSRLLRRLGFNKSHAPGDAVASKRGDIVYRRTVRPEEVPY